MTAMRERSALNADLRIVWGGRTGASGWMADILEEVVCTLKLKKPLLILGGCARLLADFLTEPNATWPERLSLASSADSARDALLTESERKELEDRMVEVKQLAAKFQKVLHSTESTDGVPASDIRKALLEKNSRSVINVAAEAVDQLR